MKNNSNLSTSKFDLFREESLFSLHFEEEYDAKAHVGKLIVKGLNLPPNPKFSPLDKIWSSVRKRIAEGFNIQVTGTFHRGKQGEIIGIFIANMASVEEGKKDILLSRFKDIFGLIMCNFEIVVESWIMNDNGLIAYKAYVDQHDHPDPEVCNKMFDEFLVSIGVKTEKDIQEREKKKKKLKKHSLLELFHRFSLDPIEDD